MSQYTLNGGGVQAVTAGTNRLYVSVIVFPNGYSTGEATPTNYFRIGAIRQGSQGAYYPAQYIDATDMVIDLHPGVTDFGYSLANVATIQVNEAVVNLGLGGVRVPNLGFSANLPANGISQTVLSYTVPTNKSALVEVVFLAVGLGATSEIFTGWIALGSQFLWYESATGPLPAPNQNGFYSFGPSFPALHMMPGETLAIAGVVAPGSTALACQASMVVMEYPSIVW